MWDFGPKQRNYQAQFPLRRLQNDGGNVRREPPKSIPTSFLIARICTLARSELGQLNTLRCGG